MSKPKRLDRDRWDARRVLRMLEDHTNPDFKDESPLIPPDEMLRLLEESCHAYLRLRDEARTLWNAIDDANEVAKGCTVELWPRWEK